MKSNGKITMGYVLAITEIVIGAPGVLFWGIGFLAGFAGYAPDPVAFFICCSIFFGIGVILLVAGICKINLLKMCSHYGDILANPSVNSLQQLSNAVGESTETVRRNLDKLIKKRYLYNVYLNQYSGRIVRLSAGANPLIMQQLVTIQCPNCCGSNSLPRGQSGFCEYCNSPIRG